MTKPVVRKLRCAVYTRKSSEEGLEQEFNSLHAQREACESSPESIGLTDPAFTEVEAPPAVSRPPTGFASMTLIVKLTRHCNLRCGYCNDWREGPNQGMGPAVQAQMMRRIAEDQTIASVRLVWHGGEPALLGVRRMLGFLWLQARLARPGQQITNIVQTNGTLLTEEVLTLWELFNFSVSVSLDGPKEIHDRQRPDRRGEGSFAATGAGIAKLKQLGIFSGALVVVTEEIAALPAEALIHGLMAAGVNRVALLPVRPESRSGTGPYLPPLDLARVLIGLFDYLRKHRDITFDVRELDALHAAWQGLGTGFCELEGPCVGSYFGIDPGGEIQHCDKFVGAERYVLGHLATTSFESIRTGQAVADLKLRSVLDRASLSGCPWFEKCRGWCPHEAHIARLRATTTGCCGLAPIFSHFSSISRLEGATVAP